MLSRRERVAYAFLRDGREAAETLSYAELDRRARALAAGLQDRGMAGERIVLLYPPGLEFVTAFFGCLYAGAVAVPAYPPGRSAHLERLLAILDDARPRLVLTSSAMLRRLGSWASRSPRLAGLTTLASDALEREGGEADWRRPALRDDSPAFLQYTSGSTATPRGVEVTHANLWHNEEAIRRAFEQSAESVIVSWLPFYHDMGLIGGILQPFYAAARCILMSPATFLRRPLLWLETISRFRATTSGGPNFAYDLCARRARPEDLRELDLSSWRVAFNGAEPVRGDTLERFAETFAPCGFRREAFFPCYGLAEATLFVTGGRPDEAPVVEPLSASGLRRHRVATARPGEPARVVVGCGRSLPDQEVVIVDPRTRRRAAADRIGEIWIAGASVARGYWRRPEETEETFRATLADDPRAGPFLRTGDLGFANDGEIFITGRLKDLVILRGRNYYPQDVELAAERAHPALRPGRGAAFAVAAEQGEELVVVLEVARGHFEHAAEIAAAARTAVSEAMEITAREVVLVRPGTIPYTSSGKVRRRRCRELYLADALEVVGRDALAEAAAAPPPHRQELTEEILAAAPRERAAAVTGHLRSWLAGVARIPEARISADRPLRELGLDSLAAVELRHAVETGLGVEVDLGELLGEGTLAGLAADVASRVAPAAREATAAAAGETPLSRGQKALWFTARLDPESPVYNVAAACRLAGPVDAAALRRALEVLAARHPALRATFHERGGEPCQRFRAGAAVAFVHAEIGAARGGRLRELVEAEAHRPFDLETGPLVRASLWSRSAGEHVLLLVLHHLVGDFWSLAILARELGPAYQRERGAAVDLAAPPAASYGDYVRWQQERLDGARGARLWEHWRRQLGDLPAAFELPTDRPRPPVRTYHGAAVALELGPALTAAVRALAHGAGATLYATLLAAFQGLLHRSTGQRDGVLGTLAAGRGAARFDRVVGYFVNPVALRLRAPGDPSFRELVEGCRRTALDALRHQDFPFALLVERLRVERDASRSPLFQVLFSLLQAPPAAPPELAALALGRGGVRVDLGGLAATGFEWSSRAAEFDLTLSVAELPEALVAGFRYRTDLFDRTTAARLLAGLRHLLADAVRDPDRRLSELSWLGAGQRAQLLVEWNDTRTAVPRDAAFHRLFEAQVERSPEAVALTAGRRSLTYRELEARANRLAHYLRRHGVAAEVPVAIATERSAAMVTALLAVLKAGGFYVPLDPSYPAARIAHALADSGAALVLTTAALGDSWPPGPARPIAVDALGEELAGESPRPPAPREGAGNLAYVIYTSGSTGRPKGVAISHRALVNFLLAMARRPGFGAPGRLLAVTTISFDIAALELFVPLLAGGRTIIARRREAADGAALRELLASSGATVMQATPATWRLLLESGWEGAPGLTALCGGEALPRPLARELLARTAGLWNLYGPTETTIWSAVHPVGAGAGPVPLGRPIANTRFVLADGWLRPVAIGAVGRLLVGGGGLARGYLRRPGLTAARFLPDARGPRPGGRLYDTGDLARHRAGGELVFLGRSDHQVKVRGFRIELGEVEAALLAHPRVRSAVAAAVDDPAGESRLAAYVVCERGPAPTADELREHLGARLPEFMVPSAFVALAELPLLPNGKVDRRALPPPRLAAPRRGRHEAPRGELQELLARLWCEVLGVERAGLGDHFFALGGHSLSAVRLLARIRQVCRLELPVVDLFRFPTLGELAEHVAARLRADAGPASPPLVRQDHAGRPPLSFAQERFWLLHQLAPGSAAYHLSGSARIAGPLEVSVLRAGLAAIQRRHEVLRASFPGDGGVPRQEIAPAPRTPLVCVDLSGLPAPARRRAAARRTAAAAARPFALDQGPLLRTVLLRLGDAEHRLLITVHHAVADGGSIAIFCRELTALYRAGRAGTAAALPALPVRYADYARWQRRKLAAARREAELAYWRQQLRGSPTVLELPADRPRPAVATLRGATRRRRLGRRLTEALGALGDAHRVTPFMTLLGIFAAWLHRLTGRRDLLVGTPIDGRERRELEGLIGCFVNTLVLRCRPRSAASFTEVLGEVRETVLGAFAHRELPFELLVDALAERRAAGVAPLVQTMLVVQAPPGGDLDMGEATLTLEEAERGAAQVDLTVFAAPGPEGLSLGFEHSTELFEGTTIERYAASFAVLAEEVAADARRRLGALSLLPPGARHQLLTEWNDTAVPGAASGLHQLFESRAEKTPDAAAVVAGARTWSYGELDRAARRLAGRLRELGVGPEVTVGVLMSRCPEMVAAMLAVLKAGGAYVPLDPAYPAARLAFMLRDSRAAVVVTEQALVPALAAGSPPLLVADAAAAAPADDPALTSRAGEGSLAYVIYTSGSTGRPKGVAITHRSAAALVRWAARTFPGIGRERVLAATSICFDLSIFEIFVPLSCGGSFVLAANALEAGETPGVTLVNTVPSAARELVRAGGLKPPTATINLAGEPLPRWLADELYALPGTREVWNLYGPSEDTTYSTAARIPAGDRRAPPIGRPVDGTRAYVADRRLAPLPPGAPGELLLGGAGLARGYLGRPAMTAERFVPDLFGGPGDRLYRTGDLVRHRGDGELGFLGRLDHQVKLRGFRVELLEIEAVLDAHPAVGEAVAVVREGRGGGQRLVAFVVPADGARFAAGELREHLARQLPEPMVPSVFVELAALPRTPSGKVDRGALPEVAGAAAATGAPRTPLEEVLAEIWAGVLGVPRVGVDDDFFALGGHSLLASRVVFRVREALGVDLPLRSLFTAPTVAALAAHLRGPRRREAPALTPAPRGEPAPLSFAQERLWFLDQLVQGSSAYNVGIGLRIRGALDLRALDAACTEIVRRHDVLRTTFDAADGRPVQRVAAPRGPGLARVDLSGLPRARREGEAQRLSAADARRPFDLRSEAPWRCGAVRLEAAHHLLLVTTHHIVFDGSHELFLRELTALYDAARRGVPPALAAPAARYADFAHWQRRRLTPERRAELVAHWRGRLGRERPVLELPSDRPRSAAGRAGGALRPVRLDQRLVAGLRELGRRQGTTLYMTLLAAFKVLLWRHTGERALTVGCPIADRPVAAAEKLIGCFTNTLALASDLDPGLAFRDFLARIRRVTLDAYAHQELPFEVLVSELSPQRDLAHTPIFQVMLSLLEPLLESGGLAPLGESVELVRRDTGTARFDLLLALWPGSGGLEGSAEYRADLFDATTIERLLGQFATLAAAAAADPERALARLPVLTAAARHQTLHEWNDTQAGSPWEATIHELVAARAAERPGAPAVVGSAESWSYGELERRANRLAHHLRARGVGPGAWVAIHLPRSPEMVMAVLAVLKAGGAYVPLESSYPRARVAWICERLGVRHAIVTADRLAALGGAEAFPTLGEVVRLERGGAVAGAAAERDDPPPPAAGPDDAAYVIFTSGSTGRPKGVMVRHRAVVNLIDWVHRTFGVGEEDRLLFVTSLCFDLSVYDVLGTLAAGASLRVASDAEVADAEALARLLVDEPITFWDSAPATLQQLVPFLPGPPAAGAERRLRLAFLSGDWIPLALPGQLRGSFPQAEVVSLGGATEATVWSNYFPVREIAPHWVSIPYGRPIRNAVYRVLDATFRPSAVGVPGDLFIGGECLAAGYAADPRQTARRYLPDPWASIGGLPGPGGRLYATGDRARHRADGEIEFLGRLDHQVKIRGFRIELGEIETVLAEHPEVGEAVVLAREDEPGNRRLVAYVVAGGGAAANPAELRAFLAEHVPDYMVPAAVVPIPAVPLTPNGKVDRAALPAPEDVRRTTGFVAPRTPAEGALAEIWADALGQAAVSVDDDLFELGAHSLLAAQVAARARTALGVELPLRTLFEAPTVAGQAAAADARRRAGVRVDEAPIVPRPRRRTLPLSSSQERLWLIDQLLPGNPVYNIHQAFRVDGPLDLAALEASLARVVERHDVLRTTFETAGGRPVQKVGAGPRIRVPLVDLGALEPEVRRAAVHALAGREARFAFDLARGPLIRLTALRLEPRCHVLSFCLHHVVGDDWSIGLLVGEVASSYRAGAAALPALAVQYGDYALWQRRWLESPALAEQIAYWRGQLAGELPVIDLPSDRPRPPVQTFRGARFPFSLPPELGPELRALGREQGSTLYMILLAAYVAMLRSVTGQNDLVVGTAVAQRGRVEIRDLIGFFVNVLPLRFRLAEELTWRGLLEQVHEIALGAFDHAEVPFEKLVEVARPPRDMSRAALRQVGFSFQNVSMRPLGFPEGLEVTPLAVDPGVARLDLTLFAWEEGEGIAGYFEYNRDLFDPATIDGFCRDFVAACRAMAEGLDAGLEPARRRAAEALATLAPSAAAWIDSSGLTESQLLFWFAQKLQPEARLYYDRAAVTFTVAGELDPEHFEHAFRALVERSDALRSRIEERGGHPRRIVAETMADGLHHLDLSAAEDPEASFRRWLAERSARPFDLERRLFDSALVRLGPERWVWFLNVHHMIVDGTSLMLIARHLSRLYALSRVGRLAAAPPLPSFASYVEAQRAYRASSRYRRAGEYWRQKLSRPVSLHPFYRRGSGDPVTRTERVTLELGRERSEGLRDLVRRNGLYSEAVFFAATLFAFLYRLDGQRRQRVGTPFANRSAELAEVIGLVMNACPLDVEIAPADSFLTLARKVQQEAIATTRHQNYPVPNPLTDRVYDVYYNFQNIAFDELCGRPVRFELLHSGSSNDSLDVQVRDFNREGVYRVDLDFNRGCFDAEQARRSAGHFLRLIDAFLASAASPVEGVPMLSPAEVRELEAFNRTRRDYPRETLLHELFERWARRSPEAPAVVADEGRLSYRDLDRRSRRLADFLRGRGVGPDVRVGIAAERSPELVVGLYGIVRAGGAYVPVDPDDPAERRSFILEDARVSVLLTQERLAPRFAGIAAEIVRLDRDWPRIAAAPACAGPAPGAQNLAYVIYTSGSTGRPKGAMVPHGGIVNRLLWMQEAYGLGPDDRVLQKTPCSFDVSVWEFFWPLMTGARLVMAEPGGHRDPGYLAAVIERRGITTLHFVPSMLQLFLDAVEPGRCPSLARVVASGEALPDPLRARFFERLDAELHNLYGPTEASVDVTFFACGRDDDLGTVPIGRPIANTRIHLVDRSLNPVPKGLAGELLIAGVNLARGYHARPAMTAERFVPDPLGGGPGERLYRTGDLARHLPDGQIEFLGRLDFQVKLRGFRIELGEIETALARHSAVREAVAVAREDRPGDPRLVAYVVAPGADPPSPAALREHLREKVPEHMVPAHWVMLDELPLTATGKVDRRALPAPDREAAREVAYVAPRGSLERLLAGICGEVLGLEKIGVHDNFFDLGGNSILATQVVTLVQEVLPVELPLRRVFEMPTIAALATLLEEMIAQLDSEEQDAVAEIFSEFEDLMAAETAGSETHDVMSLQTTPSLANERSLS